MTIRKKETLFGLGVCLLSILFAFLFIEIGLRVYQAKRETRTTITWHDDPVVGRRLNPSQKGLFVSDTKEYKTVVDINSQGFRDTEHAIPKNNFRILLIGDSFVENFQEPLEKTIFKQFQEKLSQRLQKNVEVIAMGLGDTGTAQQYLLLKNYGLTYKPDLVIQLFFSGNDVKNNSLDLMGDSYRPYYELEKDVLTLRPFSMRSEKISYKLLSFFKTKSRALEFLLNIKGKLSSKNTGFPVDYEVYRKIPNEQYLKAWKVTEALLKQTRDDTEKSGAQYLLVTLANNEQVNTTVQQALTQKYPQLGSSDFDFETPDNVLRNMCQKDSLPCTFMYPFFRQQIIKNHAVTHYPIDGHFTDVGTELATEFLTEVTTNYLTNK